VDISNVSDTRMLWLIMMNKNLIILFFNLSFLIVFLLTIPNLNYFQTIIRGLLLICLPWCLFFILIIATKKTFLKGLTVVNIVTTSLLLLFFFAIYQTHLDSRDMHFDKYKVHVLQKEAEISVSNYINKNAKFPSSYESIDFGNIVPSKVSTLRKKNITSTEIKTELERDGSDYLDTLKEESEFIRYENYGFRHSYFLKNRDGRRLFRVAFVELDDSLEVFSIYNEQDFTSISWMDYFGK
jgi:hypothetical protein